MDKNPPRAYDLSDRSEVKRLIRECRGYISVYAGTDAAGRRFAVEALDKLAGPQFNIDVFERDLETL